MKYGSMLNGWVSDALKWIGDFFGSLFDAIVKAIYFLFAAFCSGIEAMQALIRKLAGLDTYYQVATGEAISKTDPLTEFIYGILGLGENPAIYRGLSTVFWSLAVFGIIILVISTMVAIIKSHYNEDSAGTSPAKYIYTAIKSVLTFAIVPLAVVMGMVLSSFVLRTLDNITAGATTEESVKAMYGSQADQIFKSEVMKGSDEKTYSRYDFFGFGEPTNTTTFGGMLFRAAMYGSNRARSGDIDYQNYTLMKSNGKQIFGDSQCSAYASLQSDEDKRAYIADQIDYAFINCLELKQGMSYKETVEISGVRWNKFTDFFGIGQSFNNFSKFNTSNVWIFYNMWQTNWIVGFGAGITIFGIMLSIIVGLMSRLVKGAALFLIYPPLLGIAPLDNFKAFKSWVSQFMQQILMAFGAILGMNILLLLVPYLQQIAFFDIVWIDAIVQAVVVIAGLMMTKDFIGTVSSFAGGADAAGAGDGLKSGIASSFKTGLGIAGKGAAATAKFGARSLKTIGRVTGVNKLASNVTKGIALKVREGKANARIKKSMDPTSRHGKIRAEARKGFDAAKTDLASATAEIDKLRKKYNPAKANKEARAKGDEAYNAVIARGGTKEEAKAARIEAKRREMMRQNDELDKYDEQQEKARAAKESMIKHGKVLDKYDPEAIAEKSKGLKVGAGGKLVAEKVDWEGFWKGKKVKDEAGNYVIDEKTGKVKRDDTGSLHLAGQSLKDAGWTLADGFLKAVKDGIGKGIGLDKLLGGASEIFKDMRLTTAGGKVQGKWFGAGEKKLEGDKLQDAIDKKREAAEKEQLAATNLQSKKIEGLEGVLKEVLKATKATTTAVEKLGTTFTPPSSSGGSGGSGGAGGTGGTTP